MLLGVFTSRPLPWLELGNTCTSYTYLHLLKIMSRALPICPSPVCNLTPHGSSLPSHSILESQHPFTRSINPAIRTALSELLQSCSHEKRPHYGTVQYLLAVLVLRLEDACLQSTFLLLVILVLGFCFFLFFTFFPRQRVAYCIY